MIHGYMGRFGFFPFGLLGGLAELLFFGGLVLLAIWVFRAFAGPQRAGAASAAGPGQSPGDPAQILARRLAAGEISPEDYEKVRDLLKRS